ncbi:MAG: pre-peptidase C-terminal domain-containing protein [Methanomassiliicoccales archaeon]|nr:pre-peptidase C-terminal domain-containing protein [Methanomassiliicoccales archaeon]
MLILAAPSASFIIASSATATGSSQPIQESPTVIISASGAAYHVATPSEIEQMMQEIGVRSEGEAGFATGLAPPTADGWKSLEGKLLFLDSLPSAPLAPSVDLSTEPYFPIVGNQQNQGSCAAWAATYYCYGYLEARDNGWADASLGNVSHLMSPAWTYNKVNGGGDLGSWMTQNMQVICDWGCPTMRTMPYNDDDDLGWGSAAAFREAPLHRGLATVAMHCNGTDWTIDQIKTLLSGGTPVTFAIYTGGVFSSGLLDNYIVSSPEYYGTNMNHAQTIVGYNDSIAEDGDVGAFRVVNSWGSSGSEGTDHGYYWFTYAAIKKLLSMVGLDAGLCYIENRVDYTPTLLGVWHFNSGMGRNGDITLRIGAGPSATERTLYYVKDVVSTSHRMPTFMCADMTDFESQYASGTTSLHLDLGGSTAQGILSSFRVERYEGGYQPGAADQISPQSSGLPATNPVVANVVLPLDATVAYDAALDTTSHSYSSPSVSNWVGIDHISYYGGDAIESGDTADSGESSLTVDLTGPASYSFYWRVSSEASKDVLRLSVDGVLVTSISGSLGWRQQTFTIASGHHAVKWSYVKDSINSVGEDAGYVDRLRQLPPDDAFEENDNPSQAASIGPGTYAGLVCNDDDWFKVNVGAGYAVYANASFTNANGNLDLFLYAPDGSTLLDSSQTTGNVESVTTTVSESGNYYVCIRGANGDTNQYDLEVATSLVTSDLGLFASVSIVGGTLSFGDLSITNEQMAVNCGSTISGDLTILCHNPWSFFATVPLVIVPSWGPASTSYLTIDPSISTGTSTVTATITLTVPSTAGTYYIIACFRNEASGGFVASATASANGAPVWGDGNDIAGLSSSRIADAQDDGRIQVDWLIGSSEEQLWLPCDAVSIIATVPDTSPPSTMIGLSGSHGSNDWFVSAVSVSLTALDDEGGATETYYSLDGGSWSHYGAPFVIAAEGVHSLSYYSVDDSGNVEGTRQATIKIDVLAPTVAPVVAGDEGSGGWYVSVVSVDPNASDSTSGVANITYSVDSGPFQECVDDFFVGGDAEHHVSVVAVDFAGNPSDAVELTFKIDTTPPDVAPVLSGEMGAADWFISEVAVDADVIDICSGPGSWYVSVDGAAFSSSEVTVTAGGEHTLSYYGLDAAGNPSAVAEITFKIDTGAPQTTIAVLADEGRNGWVISNATVNLTPSDDQSGVLATCVSLDDEPWHTVSAPFVVSEEGTHVLRYYSVDAAGNVEEERTEEIRIDASAPTSSATISGPEGTQGWYRGNVTTTLEAVDSGSGIGNITFRLDEGAWTDYTHTVTVSTNGAHLIEFFSMDVAGRREIVNSVEFIIDTGIPNTTALIAATEGSNGWYIGTVSVTLVANDGDGAVSNTTYRIDSGPWTGYETSVILTAEGHHSIDYRSEDAAGNIEAVKTLSLSLDSTPPAMSGILATPTHSTDGSVTVKWNSSDGCSGLNGTELIVDGVSQGSPTAEGGVAVLQGLSDGTHNITVVSVDVAGNRAEGSTVVTVDTNPLSPSGPYGVLLDIVIVATTCALAGAFLLTRKKPK